MQTPKKKYSTKNHLDKLGEFYGWDIPDYILQAGKSFIKIRVSDWRGEQDLRITPKDVAEYYCKWVGNITSGCRVIAGYAGDWRPIDRLVKECLVWFKVVNIEALRREGRRYGITHKE